MAGKNGTGPSKERSPEAVAPRRIVLDVDTGHDDAVAIMMAAAAPELSLDMITVTAGNQTLPKTLNNTLNLCDDLGIDVPVYAGATGPLMRELVPAARIHGESGFDGPIFKPRKKQAEKGHAVNALIEYLMDAIPGSTTIIALGPLTNIALAMKLEPSISSRIGELILMGGAIGRGNVTPSAEFNIHADPEAAKIVFGSGAAVTMIGLDVTTKILLDEQKMIDVRLIRGRASEIFVDSMDNYMTACRKYLGEYPAMHDPSCVAYVIEPELFRLGEYHVDVECSGEVTSGRTVVDIMGVSGKPKNARVAVDVLPDLFWPLLERTIRRWTYLGKR